jgi:hypothetical protein
MLAAPQQVSGMIYGFFMRFSRSQGRRLRRRIEP